MQIAQVIGGYTLGAADLLRRAMGKKKPEEMAQQRDIFVAGAEKNGLSRAEGGAALRPDGEVRRLRLQQVARRRVRAGRLPDRVLQGASRRGVHGGEPVARDGRHRQGARRSTTMRVAQGLAILPPDVNASRLPLRAGRRAAASATAWAASRAPARRRSTRSSRRARRAGLSPTCSISAAASTSASSTAASSRRWCARAPSMRSTRAARRCSPPSALRSMPASAPTATASQVSLFGEEAARADGRRRSPTREWTEAERLAQEKAALGFYLSGHPFAAYASRACADRAHVARDAAAEERARARRRDRHDAARADEPARQDGVRHARRRQGPRRGDGLQRDVRRRARAAARGPARHPRDPRDAADDRRRRVAGTARHRRERVRPRRRSASARRKGFASRATAMRRPIALPKSCSRSGRARRRSPCATRTSASAASSSCPRPGG